MFRLKWAWVRDPKRQTDFYSKNNAIHLFFPPRGRKCWFRSLLLTYLSLLHRDFRVARNTYYFLLMHHQRVLLRFNVRCKSHCRLPVPVWDVVLSSIPRLYLTDLDADSDRLRMLGSYAAYKYFSRLPRGTGVYHFGRSRASDAMNDFRSF